MLLSEEEVKKQSTTLEPAERCSDYLKELEGEERERGECGIAECLLFSQRRRRDWLL